MKNRLFLTVLIGLAFCIVAWTVNAQIQRTTRQSWEFKKIVVGTAAWTENDRSLGGNPAQYLWPKLQELGDQGWEIISTSDCKDETGVTTLWLKRPK